MATPSLAEKFYVYVHHRLSTGEPFYIGKGHARRAWTRKSRRPHWKNIVAKDGGFSVRLIAENLDEELSLLVEMEAISQYRANGCNLVNLTDGGDGVTGYRPTKAPWNKGIPCSEEVKEKISATNKERGVLPPIGWNLGKKTPTEVIRKRRPALLAAWAKAKEDGSRAVSNETRARMSASAKGRAVSNETREKLSLALKANNFVRTRPDMTGFQHSDESRARMSKGMKGRPASNRKAVLRIDTGEVFESAIAAAKSIGKTTHALVAACCRGAVPTAYGLRFSYAEGINV